MTIAQKLKLEGWYEGFLEGYQQGLWQGRLTALQQIMGLPVDSEVQLDAIPTEELRHRCEVLLAEYSAITRNDFISCHRHSWAGFASVPFLDGSRGIGSESRPWCGFD